MEMLPKYGQEGHGDKKLATPSRRLNRVETAKRLAALKHASSTAEFEAEYAEAIERFPDIAGLLEIYSGGPASPVGFSPGPGFTPLKRSIFGAPGISGKTPCSPPRSPRSPKLATSVRRATSHFPTPKLSTIKQGTAASITTPAADSSPVRNMMRLLDKLPLRTGGSVTEGKRTSPPPTDTEDLLTLRYGCKVVLRGSHGRYIAARQAPCEKWENMSSSHRATSGIESSSTKAKAPDCATTCAAARVPHFLAHAGGIGTGSQAEALVLVNAGFRDDRGPVRFGDTVALRSRFARERFLALTADGDLHFSRVHIGQVERWVIKFPEEVQKPLLDARGLPKGSGGETLTKQGSQPVFVRTGDPIVLFHVHSGLHMILQDDNDYGLSLNAVDPGMFRANEGMYGIWQIALSGIPFYPDWHYSRKYLNGQFLVDEDRLNLSPEEAVLFPMKLRGPEKPLELTALSLEKQELLLLDDLLAALAGAEGRYVKASITENLVAHFELREGGAEESLGYLVGKFLPLCDSFVRVNAFVASRSQYDYGMVAHALSAGIRSLLQEYMVLIAQLEMQLRAGRLTMQKMWFYLQPTLQTMEQLDTIVSSATDIVGGALINKLVKVSSSGGDAGARALTKFLLRNAAQPYLEMLASWIYNGQLADPYGEFMVREEDTLDKENVREDFNAQYWENRYTIEEEMVCSFLSELANKILTTGKYLNVVRECGRALSCPHKASICIDAADGSLGSSSQYADIVANAYEFSSKTLLDLVLNENALLPRLHSIKHYFLLDRGDFVVHFMQLAVEELCKKVSRISVNRLESLLHLSVQTSSAGSDPYKDDVSLEFSSYNLINHLELIHSRSAASTLFPNNENVSTTGVLPSSPLKWQGQPFANDGSNKVAAGSSLLGIDSIMVTYRVTWPLSLVVSKRAITKFQLLFRHLFFTKHVERMLLHTWLDHQASKELSLRDLLARTYTLRHRMLHFIQNFLYYITFEVIEPRWHEMEAALNMSKTVDEVLHCYGEFQDTCLKECLLTNQELLKILTKLMTVCLYFSESMKKFARTKGETHDELHDSVHERGQPLTASSSTLHRRRQILLESEHFQGTLSSPAYSSMITKFESHFDEFLYQFMNRLWNDSQHLATRLDFNFYVSNSMGKRDVVLTRIDMTTTLKAGAHSF